MPDVTMPRLSDSMEEGTILKWLKSDGDDVSKGEELVEIETDKANMTYEADESGTLEIVAQEGDTLAVGETIARIGEGGGGDSSDEDEDERRRARGQGGRGDEESDEDEDEGDEEEEEEPEADADEDEEEDDEEEPAEEDEEPEEDEGDSGDEEAKENGRVKASPIARRMAREMGLELAGVKGTGPGGRIVKADVEAAAKQDDKPAEKEEPEKKEEAPKKEKAPPRRRTPAAARSRRRSSRGCSGRSRGGWRSPRRPRRTS